MPNKHYEITHKAMHDPSDRKVPIKRGEALQGHTPGPWTVYTEPNCVDGNGEPIIPVHAPSGRHLQVVADTYGSTTETREANARLIATAPEMLEALRKIHDEADHILGTDGDDPLEVARQNAAEIRGLARAAIAKAEGRDQ